MFACKCALGCNIAIIELYGVQFLLATLRHITMSKAGGGLKLIGAQIKHDVDRNILIPSSRSVPSQVERPALPDCVNATN